MKKVPEAAIAVTRGEGYPLSCIPAFYEEAKSDLGATQDD